MTPQDRITDWTWGRVRERWEAEGIVHRDVDHKMWMDLGWGVLRQLPLRNEVVTNTMEAMNA